MKPLPALLATAMALALVAPANATDLSKAAADAVLRALDDEYHAEAVYAATLATFGDVRPFSNIIEAERQHQAALVGLMQSHDLPVPANAYLTGEKPLGDLPATLQEVCAIGAAAEVENARLYDEDLIPAAAGYADIVTVFTALRDASVNNHLPAFQRCASGKGHGNGNGNG